MGGPPGWVGEPWKSPMVVQDEAGLGRRPIHTAGCYPPFGDMWWVGWTPGQGLQMTRVSWLGAVVRLQAMGQVRGPAPMEAQVLPPIEGVDRGPSRGSDASGTHRLHAGGGLGRRGRQRRGGGDGPTHRAGHPPGTLALEPGERFDLDELRLRQSEDVVSGGPSKSRRLSPSPREESRSMARAAKGNASTRRVEEKTRGRRPSTMVAPPDRLTAPRDLKGRGRRGAFRAEPGSPPSEQPGRGARPG